MQRNFRNDSDIGVFSIPVEPNSEDYVTVTYALRLALGVARLEDISVYKIDNPQTRAAFEEARSRISQKDAHNSKPIDVWVNVMDLDDNNKLPDIQKRGILVIPPGLPVLAGHIPIETETPTIEGGVSRKRHGKGMNYKARKYSFILSSLSLGKETAVDSINASDFDKFKKDGKFLVPDGYDTLYVHTERSGIPSIDEMFRKVISSVSVAGNNDNNKSLSMISQMGPRGGVSQHSIDSNISVRDQLDDDNVGITGLGSLKDSYLYITRSSNYIFPRFLVTFSIDPSFLESLKKSAGLASDRDRFVPQCGVCGERKSAVYCLSDQEFFCESCDMNFHKNKIAAKHKRIPALEYISSNKGELFGLNFANGDSSNMLCREHGKPLDYFDIDLGVPICVDCKMIGSHSKGRYANNTIVPVSSIYDQCMNELEEESRDINGIYLIGSTNDTNNDKIIGNNNITNDSLSTKPERTLVSGLIEELSSSVQSIGKRMKKLYFNYKSCEKKLEFQFMKLKQQLIDVVRSEFIFYYVAQLETRRNLTSLRNEARLPGLLLIGDNNTTRGNGGYSPSALQERTSSNSILGNNVSINPSQRLSQAKRRMQYIDPVSLIELFRGRQISLTNLQYENPNDIRSWTQDVVDRGDIRFSGSLSIIAGDETGIDYNFDFNTPKPYGFDDGDGAFYGGVVGGAGYDDYDTYGIGDKKSVQFLKSIMKKENNSGNYGNTVGTNSIRMGMSNEIDRLGANTRGVEYIGNNIGITSNSDINLFSSDPGFDNDRNNYNNGLYSNKQTEMRPPKGGVPFEMKKTSNGSNNNNNNKAMSYGDLNDEHNTQTGEKSGNYVPYLYNSRQALHDEIEKNGPRLLNTTSSDSGIIKKEIAISSPVQTTPKVNMTYRTSNRSSPLGESFAQNDSTANFNNPNNEKKIKDVEYVVTNEQINRLSRKNSPSIVPGDKFSQSRSASLSPSAIRQIAATPPSRSSSVMRTEIHYNPLADDEKGMNDGTKLIDSRISNSRSSSSGAIRSTKLYSEIKNRNEKGDRGGVMMTEFAESKRQQFLVKNPGYQFMTIPFDESNILKRLDSILKSTKQLSQDAKQNILLVKQMLYFCLPFRIPVTTHLVYSTSINEPSIYSFLKRVDRKGSTLLLISSNGALFGGFASTNWDTEATGKPFGSVKCFLFSIGIIFNENTIELSIKDSRYHKCNGAIPLRVTSEAISFGRDLVIRDISVKTSNGMEPRMCFEYECRLGNDYDGEGYLGGKRRGIIDAMEVFNFTN